VSSSGTSTVTVETTVGLEREMPASPDVAEATAIDPHVHCIVAGINSKCVMAAATNETAAIVNSTSSVKTTSSLGRMTAHHDINVVECIVGRLLIHASPWCFHSPICQFLLNRQIKVQKENVMLAHQNQLR